MEWDYNGGRPQGEGTMRLVSMLCLFSLLAFQQKCELGSPQQIKTTVEADLQPYFQNANAVASPETHRIVALTCIQGAGPKLVAQSAQMLVDELGKNDARSIATRVGLAAKGYKQVILGFDSAYVVFDLQSRQTTVMPAVATYQELYSRGCNVK